MTDINCDMGESYGRFRLGNDEAVMPYITSCNIACGFHAGDPLTMERTLLLAKKHGVHAGAHPSFPDLAGFGRRPMKLPPEELRSLLVYQISALKGMAQSLGMKIRHVKPHGALYHTVSTDEEAACAFTEAVYAIDPELLVFGPAQMPEGKNKALFNACREKGLRYLHETFADRNYLDDGSLVPRSHPRAMLHNPEEIAKRARLMLHEKTVTTLSGKKIPLHTDTLCLHGDHPRATEIAKALWGEIGKIGEIDESG